jgi:hypothetical protein
VTVEFRTDFEQLCQKYGGFHGVLERMSDMEKDFALKMIEADRPDRAVFYSQLAYQLLNLRDYWLSDK